MGKTVENLTTDEEKTNASVNLVEQGLLDMSTFHVERTLTTEAIHNESKRDRARYAKISNWNLRLFWKTNF